MMNIKDEQDAINKLALNEWKEVKKDFVETTDRIKDFCEYRVNESSISVCPRCKEATTHIDRDGKSICVKCNSEEKNEWVATPENEEKKKVDPTKCKICGKPSNPEWSAEDGEYCSKECLMTYSGKVEEEKAAIITVGSTAKLIKEDMGAKGNVDLEIGDKKYNFDYDVDYKWSGKYHPASMSGPEEFPELEILNIAYSDITEYGVDVDKKVKWEEIPEDIRKAIDEKFGDKWLEDFVEEEQDYDPD